MRDKPADSQPCELLSWDSEFFGFVVARTTSATLDDEKARLIDRWCIERGVQLLYFIARSDNAHTESAARRAGFYLTDVRLTFEFDQLGNPPILSADWPTQLRNAEEADIPALRRIARSAHRDTRFYFDGHIPQMRCDELYCRWIEASCKGFAEAVLVIGPVSSPTGYVTCHLKPESSEGSIGLIAVAPEARGTGLGKQLVTEAMNWFFNNGRSIISVVTQGRNIVAQRLYQRQGFVTRSLELYFHKWYEPTENING